jgi:ADP-ribosylglycohydrolase
VHDPLDLRDILADELTQRLESGYLVAGLVEPIEAALRAATGPADPALERLLEALEASARDPAWPYEEPEEAEAILAALGAERSAAWQPSSAARQPPSDDLADRVLGAWLGRCAGCTLGKPVEGLPRERLIEYLSAARCDPRLDYIAAPSGLPEAFGLKETWPTATRGGIHGAPRDDDIDYTVLALRLLEQRGPGFEAGDVTENLLLSLPYLRVFTAERATYRNLIHGLSPPATARHRNPYREWIGALIRADMYGYVSPGLPGRAARLALVDASTSHSANGVYAAMWAAALVAAALVTDEARSALLVAASLVPAGSRLAAAVVVPLDEHAAGRSWEDALAKLDSAVGRYGWVHAIPNAAAISAGLLWGADDFGATVGFTVLAGLDTDSAAATAGSVWGAIHGARALPAHWTEPLADRVQSAVMGFDGVRISELARRTLALASASVRAGAGA